MSVDPEDSGRIDRQTLQHLLDPEHYLGSSGELVDRVLRRYREEIGRITAGTPIPGYR